MKDAIKKKAADMEDIELTSWATGVFVESAGDAAPKPDMFKLGAGYVYNNPTDYMITRVKRLVSKYEDLSVFDADFVNRGYCDFVKRHWNDKFDMDCPIAEMRIELQPEEMEDSKK